MSEAERQDVIDRLQGHEDRIQALMRFIDDIISSNRHFTREEKAKAQEQMRDLKIALEQDYRRGATAKGRDEMTEYERAYLHHAVHQALCEFQSRWNSDPIKSRWPGELYAAHIDIAHSLNQLKERG